MTAMEFQHALRRFIARKAKPKFILSDNAPQFKLVKSTVDMMWKNIHQDADLADYCSANGINWTFITEFAPWQGGVYERMVGIVKQSLRKALGKSLLNLSQLSTIMCEVEAIVNSRPLTHVSEDLEGVPVLTPGHFLMLNPKVGVPNVTDDDFAKDPDYEPTNTTSTEVIRNWKKGQHLLNEFWKISKSDYLFGLREKISYQHPTKRHCSFSPRLGDLVIVKDETPRGTWKLGKITGLKKSTDNAIRAAYVQLHSKTTLCRPINLLYPLEFPVNNPEITEEDGSLRPPVHPPI